MVDFGNSVFEGKLEASVPLLSPVDDKSGETFAGALADGMDRFNKTVFSAEARAGQVDSAKNSFFSDYAEQVGLLADAKDQNMGTDEAMRRLRVLDNQFLSNHPEMTEDFFTFRGKLMTENGFGGNIIKETPQEAGQREKIKAATAEGWDTSNPDSMAAFDRQQQNKIWINQATQTIDMAEAEGKLVTAQMKADATLALHSVVADGLQWVNDQINSGYKQLQGVTDPAQRQAIIDETKAKIAQQSAIIGDLRSKSANAIDTSYLMTGVEGLVTNFETVASGKSTLENVENANKMIEAHYKNLMLTSDPELAALVVADSTSKFQNPEAYMKLDQKRMDWAARLNTQVTIGDDGKLSSSIKPPDLVDTVENVAVVFDDLKQTTANIVKDSGADKEAVTAQANKIVNVLRSTAKYGANDGDAKNFTAVVDFFADPTVGKFMETNATSIYPQVAAEARYVIEQQYDSVVIPLITERWSTAAEGIMTGEGSTIGNVDVANLVEPIWNGVGIEFVAKPEFKDDFRVFTLVKDLNQGPNSIAPPLNKLIRAKAHMSGTTDYEKVYNEGYKAKLWVTGKEGDKKPVAGQEADKLSTLTNIPEGSLKAPERPTDYTETPTALRGQTGKLLDAIGAAEGATYDTMYGYAEREGGAFAGTKVTSLTLDEVASLQKEMVKKNGISSAIGKYQFIQGTLKEAIKGLGLKGDEKFTPELQDRLALWLLKNRTSYDDWATGTGDAAKFQNELASQWASIPNTSGKSAYASDGVNNASSEGKRLIGML